MRLTAACALFASLIASASVRAEIGAETWLRYERLDQQAAQQYRDFPAAVVVLGNSELLSTASEELVRGIHGTLGRTPRLGGAYASSEPAIILGRLAAIQESIPGLRPSEPLADDGFWLTGVRIRGRESFVIAAPNDRGVLYGVFALLRKIARAESLAHLREIQKPYAPIRWVDQWDNLDGRIERGYAGRSIFFENGDVRADLSRASAYARLLASVGIDGCTINNVNADAHLLDD